MSAVSNAWGKTTTLSSSDPGRVVPTAGDLSTAPASLDPDVFRSWTTAEQTDYIEAKGSGTPKSVTIGPADGARIDASIGPIRYAIASVRVGAGLSLSVEPSFPSRAATSEQKATKPDRLDPAKFLEWNSADREAYLKSQSMTAVGDKLTIGNDLLGKIEVSVATDVAIKGSVIFNVGAVSDIPYLQLDGSSAGARATGWRAGANAAFPPIDGVNYTLPVAERPTGFYILPDSYQDKISTPPDADDDNTPAKLAIKAQRREDFLKEFQKWPSQYQLEYVKSNGTNGTLVIPATGTPILSVFVSRVDATKLNMVVTPAGTMTREALGKMPKTDQDFVFGSMTTTHELLATSATIFSTASSSVKDISMLSGNATISSLPSVTVETSILNLIDYIDNKKTTLRGATYKGNVETKSDANPQTAAEKAAGVYYMLTEKKDFKGKGDTVWIWMKFEAPPAPLPLADRLAFTSQLVLLKEQMAGIGFVAPGSIQTKLKDLKDRFDRAFAFYDVKGPMAEAHQMGDPNEYTTVYRDVISLDDNATINRGYQIFIAQEKQIAELTEARMQMVRGNGSLFGKKMDLPELVYRFQSLYSLQVQASTIMETEEVNQQNALVKTYGAMRDILSQTLAKFEKSSDTNDKYIQDRGVDDLAPSRNKFTRQELMTMSMFEDFTGNGQRHPLETIGNIARPQREIFVQPSYLGDADRKNNYDLAGQTYLEWNQFSTALEERVTAINQNLQIKMNDVTSLDKQANRHFDLANSALAKMNEMLNNIARAG